MSIFYIRKRAQFGFTSIFWEVKNVLKLQAFKSPKFNLSNQVKLCLEIENKEKEDKYDYSDDLAIDPSLRQATKEYERRLDQAAIDALID